MPTRKQFLQSSFPVPTPPTSDWHHDIEEGTTSGIGTCFHWGKTIEGRDFWARVIMRRADTWLKMRGMKS